VTDQIERPRPSDAVEDYAKAIFALEEAAAPDAPVSTNALAARLGVSAGSASAMLKKLDALGLASHEPYHGVRLTEAGRRVALEVLRHHRLLELYLSEELGVPWDRVHAEAEVWEHVLSEDVEARMAAKLGHPAVDPHGDPIPSPDLELADVAAATLDDCPVGATGRFVRVPDADPEVLRYLSSCDIGLGQPFAVVDRQPFGGPTFARFGAGDVQPLGRELARAMRVEVDPS
jgi:DtxR family Mn-dependent transcriptional regulator